MKRTSPSSFAAFLIGSLLVSSAYGCTSGPDAESILDPSVETSSATELESLVAAAIDRAVVSEKDIPDYGLLADKSRIIVSRITAEGERLTPSWAVGRDSDAVYLSGGGYELRYLDADGSWVFDRVLATWMS